MSLGRELFALAERADACLSPPPLGAVLIVDPRPAPGREAEFGLLALADGSAGLYYAWLGTTQADMPARYTETALVGRSALALAGQFLGGSDAERSVGIAAINAITAYTWRRAGYTPATATDSLAGLELGPDDHLGMIGYFPPLVRRARELGAVVSVVERKQHMVADEPGLRITLDTRVLGDCNKIICTGATLVNDSLETMLGHCRKAAEIALVGPTVGCFPDPLFARGVDIVAGTRIIDAAGARARLAAGNRIGDCAARYAIRRTEYPGFEVLLTDAVTGRGNG